MVGKSLMESQRPSSQSSSPQQLHVSSVALSSLQHSIIYLRSASSVASGPGLEAPAFNSDISSQAFEEGFACLPDVCLEASRLQQIKDVVDGPTVVIVVVRAALLYSVPCLRKECECSVCTPTSPCVCFECPSSGPAKSLLELVMSPGLSDFSMNDLQRGGAHHREGRQSQYLCERQRMEEERSGVARAAVQAASVLTVSKMERSALTVVLNVEGLRHQKSEGFSVRAQMVLKMATKRTPNTFTRSSQRNPTKSPLQKTRSTWHASAEERSSFSQTLAEEWE